MTACHHYERKCDIFAPCCQRYYPCRRCHDQEQDHHLDRYRIETIRCRGCGQEQPPANECVSCGIRFADYYCDICHLWCDKEIFHCDLCRTCFFEKTHHCEQCGICFSTENHPCFNRILSETEECCICLEPLIRHIKAPYELPCHHIIHRECMEAMIEKNHIGCPLCKKTMLPIDWRWAQLVQHLYRSATDKKIRILCNDCLVHTEIGNHPFLWPCPSCHSLNTSRL